MNTYLKALFTLVIIALPNMLLAQNFLKGIVVNNDNITIANAIIRIFKDSVLYKTVLSDGAGHYEILHLINGNYRLECTAAGYVNRYIVFTLQQDTSINVNLVPAIKELAEINVTGIKPFIEKKIDRTIFNIENSIYSKGFTAIEVLKTIPRIEVTGNDDIKIIGQNNVRIMIDGRLVYLSDENIKSKLRSLRSDDIASIEVIPIPPAKYSASVNSGLINIILKKSPLLGWKAGINTSYIQREYSSYSQTANVSYKSKQIEVSLGLNNERSKFLNENDIFYDLFTTGRSLHDLKKTKRSNHGQSVNSIFKYKINNRQEIGVVFDYRQQHNRIIESANDHYFSKEPVEKIDSIINSSSLFKNEPSALAISTYYDYNIDTSGKNMSLTYSYANNTDRSSRSINSDITCCQVKQISALSYFGNNEYKIQAMMADFELPYRFAKIGAGGAYTVINNETGLKLYKSINNELIEDSSATNNFVYTENTAAIYVSASKDFNKKWSGKIGLRYEQTIIKGESATLDINNRTDYRNIFPSLFILYNYNRKGSFSFAYSKSIQRPAFNDLNPFRYYSDIYSYTSGNAYLLPSVSNKAELTFTYRNNLTVILSGLRSVKNTGYVTTFSKGMNISMPENYFDQNRVGLDIMYSYSVATWWSILSSANIYYNQSRPYVQDLQIPNTDGYGASARINNTFTLNKRRETYIGLSYNQFFPSKDGFSQIKSFGYLSFNFRNSIIKKRLTFVFSALDIFKQNHTISTMEYRSFISTSSFNPHLQNIRFSVTYNLGKNNIRNITKDIKQTDALRANK